MTISGSSPDSATIGGLVQLARTLALQARGQEFKSLILHHLFAVCPGGEGAVLKTVGRKRFVGSNPMHGAIISGSSKKEMLAPWRGVERGNNRVNNS